MPLTLPAASSSSGSPLYTAAGAAQTRHNTFGRKTVAIPASGVGQATITLAGAAAYSSALTYLPLAINIIGGSLNPAVLTAAASPIAGGTIAGLTNPYGVAVDSAGNIFVANSGANTVQIYTSSGAASPIAGGTIAGLNSPFGVAVDSAGNIYVANSGANNVLAFSSSGDLVLFSNAPVATTNNFGGSPILTLSPISGSQCVLACTGIYGIVLVAYELDGY